MNTGSDRSAYGSRGRGKLGVYVTVAAALGGLMGFMPAALAPKPVSSGEIMFVKQDQRVLPSETRAYVVIGQVDLRQGLSTLIRIEADGTEL